MNNNQLLRLAKNIPNFRGVFMRNCLPKKIKENECAIVNLDNLTGPGTHWVAYIKKKKLVKYFDSFGNLQPPLELIRYFGKTKIIYNKKRYQSFNSNICGTLCLKFLRNNS